jgi:PAS domain S-box-containing protein
VLKVASGVSGSAGSAFFEHLVKSMADALGAQAGFIARLLLEEPPRARTISVVIEGRQVENFEYDLDGTPCERFKHDTACIVRENVSGLFPHSERLKTFGAQGYVGYRLDDSRGRPLGLIFVLFRQSLKEVDFITSTLQIFAARAAAELERYEADARIRNQAALLDNTQDAIIVCDIEHSILFWNKGAERLFGWTADETLKKRKADLLGGDPAMNQQAIATVLRDGEWSGLLSYRRKDGSVVPVEAHWSLVNDDEDRAQAIFTITTDITQRNAYEQEIQNLAFYDALTGLPNRRLLLDRLEKAVSDSARKHRIGALLFIDLDNFKSSNDTVGHDKGDRLLQQVAERLKCA